MQRDDWPSVSIQKAILKDFAMWLNRDESIAGIYGPPDPESKAKVKPRIHFDEDMITRAVELFIQEQGDGRRRSPL